MALCEPSQAACERHGVKRTLLLAPEGINGTNAGAEAGVRAVLAHLRADPRLARLPHKMFKSKKPPFLRMKVWLKKEIVTLRVPELDPKKTVGRYVKPADRNALLVDPEALLIDTRNTTMRWPLAATSALSTPSQDLHRAAGLARCPGAVAG